MIQRCRSTKKCKSKKYLEVLSDPSKVIQQFLRINYFDNCKFRPQLNLIHECIFCALNDIIQCCHQTFRKSLFQVSICPMNYFTLIAGVISRKSIVYIGLFRLLWPSGHKQLIEFWHRLYTQKNKQKIDKTISVHITPIVKGHIFWEGHKILRNLDLRFFFKNSLYPDFIVIFEKNLYKIWIKLEKSLYPDFIQIISYFF